MDDEILYRRFESPVEAELLAEYLRVHGIDARVGDAQTVAVYPLAQGAFGGVKVLVPRDRLEEADGLARALDASRTDAQRADADHQEPSTQRSAEDELAHRAFMAAVVGLVFCPGLLHMISLTRVLRVERLTLTAAGRRDWTRAFAIDTVVLLTVLAIVVAYLLR